MAKITIRAKVQDMIYYGSDIVAFHNVQIPKLDRKHCDMNAFRTHVKYGAYANSDLFKNMLLAIRKQTFGSDGVLKLNALPEGVTVDTSGFLAVVTFDV
jgi:hypothetical protein